VLRFKLAENLPVEVAELLSTAGHDAVTVAHERLGGAQDERLLVVCRAEGRALVTLDVGLGNIRRYPPHDHAGVILLRLERQDKPSVMHVLARVVPLLEREPISERLWIVDERGLRVRKG
jgi:predicted nuclease of predicted toxin-antitoxin system